MEVKEKGSRNLIIRLFNNKGINLPDGENPLAFLVTKEKSEFIRLYIDGHKIIIFEDDMHHDLDCNAYHHIRNQCIEYNNTYKKMETTNILDIITPEAKLELEKIWFTADQHHGHDKIIKFCDRPTTPEEHDNWIIKETWNKYIGKKDRVYILGDLSMANRKQAELFIEKLNGQKYLILGNHDKNIHNSTHFVQISQIKDFTYYKFGLNIHIVLCHYPMMSWSRSIHGSWHLYGHVHGRTKHPGLAMDVGIDNKDFEGYRPINLYEICEFMSIKQNSLKEFTH